MHSKLPESAAGESILSGNRFVRACLRKPVDRTPVWFLRQAGRYMQEYRDVRKHHTLVEICKQPELAAEVTITAAEKLGVDAAIIFADLLLPLEPMGLDFEFQAGEGPVVHKPVRTADDVRALRTDRAAELGYVARAIEKVAVHFRDRLGIIGFCGAPFTLASYMIEGGASRTFLETKQLMYRDEGLWRRLMGKLVDVLGSFALLQVSAGARVIQVFDSWVGALGPDDYVRYVAQYSRALIERIRQTGTPVIHFGTGAAGFFRELHAAIPVVDIARHAARQDQRLLGVDEKIGRLLHQVGRRPLHHRRHVALGLDRRQRSRELAFLHLGVEVDIGRAARRRVRHPIGAQHRFTGRARRCRPPHRDTRRTEVL